MRSTVYDGNGSVSIGYDEAHAGGRGGDVHLGRGNGVVDCLAVWEAAGQAGGLPTEGKGQGEVECKPRVTHLQLNIFY